MASAALAPQTAVHCSAALHQANRASTTCKRTFVCQLRACNNGRAAQLRSNNVLPRSFLLGDRLASAAGLSASPVASNSRSSVRCMAEPGSPSSEGTSVDAWLGRAAMLAFTAVLATEITTGKGVFELAGLQTPSPGLAIAVTVLLGGGAILSISRSLFK